ncbi:facilitated trehalose transporter Tret1-2 homolog [Periplaneta americana]|uniref:facilitated trehalose transporter Tret1-2 homolog n=1 Tax=Periplaneta americana TaxID=6978 RepID=UPI0037E82EED
MVFRQLLVAFVSCTTVIPTGMTIGFSGVAIPQLMNGPDQLSQDEASWFASLNSIATIFGCLAISPLLEMFGRKWGLLLVNIPCVFGWILHFLTPTPAPVYILYIARLLNGFAGGMGCVSALMYIGETSTAKLRSVLLTWPAAAISIGILFVYFLGWLIQDSWRTVAAISTIFPVLSIALLLIFIKESPSWLLKKGRQSDAEASFRWLRNIKCDEELPESLREEFDSIVSFVNKNFSSENLTIERNTEVSEIVVSKRASKGTNESRANRFDSKIKFLLSLTTPDIMKPLVIINVYFLFLSFSGVFAVIYYAVDIMNSAGISMDPYLAALILGAVKVVTGCVFNLAHHRFGRRTMSMICGIMMTLTMVGIGLYLRIIRAYQYDETQSPDLSWIPLILILIYIGVSAFGFNTLPWAMIGELFPVRIKDFAGGFSTCLAYVFIFVAVKLFPATSDAFTGGDPENSSEGVFFLFGFICFIASIFIFFFLPETFKKSLEEISDEFSRPGVCQFKFCSKDTSEK